MKVVVRGQNGSARWWIEFTRLNSLDDGKTAREKGRKLTAKVWRGKRTGNVESRAKMRRDPAVFFFSFGSAAVRP